MTLALLPEGPKSPLTKFMSEEELGAIVSAMGGETGDLLLFVADSEKVANDVLWRLRVRMGEQLEADRSRGDGALLGGGLPAAGGDRGERQVQRYHATHNPFSGMQPGQEALLETEPLKVIARQYDIIGNGYEIGGGSIRINVPELQRTIFQSARPLTTSRSRSSSATCSKPSNRRAAPRRHRARHRPAGDAAGRRRDDPRRDGLPQECRTARTLLMRAPSPVAEEQLRDLHLRIREPEKK